MINRKIFFKSGARILSPLRSGGQNFDIGQCLKESGSQGSRSREFDLGFGFGGRSRITSLAMVRIQHCGTPASRSPWQRHDTSLSRSSSAITYCRSQSLDSSAPASSVTLPSTAFHPPARTPLGQRRI